MRSKRDLNRKEIIEYYRTHDCFETEAKYNISHGTLFNIVREFNALKGAGRKSTITITPEMIEYKKTHTYYEVAVKFNLPPASTYQAFRRIGALTKKRVDKDEFTAFYNTHSYAEIAERFNLTYRKIEYYRRMFFLEKKESPAKNRIRRSPSEKVTIVQMVRYLAEKFTITEIGILLNLTPSAISKIIHEVY